MGIGSYCQRLLEVPFAQSSHQLAPFFFLVSASCTLVPFFSLSIVHFVSPRVSLVLSLEDGTKSNQRGFLHRRMWILFLVPHLVEFQLIIQFGIIKWILTTTSAYYMARDIALGLVLAPTPPPDPYTSSLWKAIWNIRSTWESGVACLKNMCWYLAYRRRLSRKGCVGDMYLRLVQYCSSI